MGIFLRQSYNVKPPRWGSPADIEYAVKVNAEKVYDIDPDSIVLCMPLFWGLPCLDYSGKRNDGVNHGAYYKDGELEFVAADNDYIDTGLSINLSNEDFTISGWFKGSDPKYIVAQTHTVAPYGSDWIFGGSGVELIWMRTVTLGTATSIEDGNWHHLVMRWNKSAEKYDGFVDNVNIGTSGIISGYGGINSVKIGSQGNGTSAFVNGSVAKVCIFNVGLLDDQIALFHALPYGLYQPVIRPHYSLPMPPYVFTKNLSDTINISDVILSKNIGLNKADTISLSDSIVKKPGLNKADTISLSDSIVKKPGLNKADNISLSDDISSKSFGLNKADTISLTDSIAKTFSFSKADTISMTDNIIKTFGLNKNDTITLSDLMIKTFGLNKADTITLSDSITKAFGLSLSDTINMTDSSAFGLIVALLDFIAKNKTFNFNAKNAGG